MNNCSTLSVLHQCCIWHGPVRHAAWPFPGLMKQTPRWCVISSHLTIYPSACVSGWQNRLSNSAFTLANVFSSSCKFHLWKATLILIPVFWYPTLSDIVPAADGIGQKKSPEQSHILDHMVAQCICPVDFMQVKCFSLLNENTTAIYFQSFDRILIMYIYFTFH